MVSRFEPAMDAGLYVEVGFGEVPAGLYGLRRYVSGRRYRGYDNASGKIYPREGERFDSVMRRIFPRLLADCQSNRPGENIVLNAADICDPDLQEPKASALEVYAANVINSPMEVAARVQILSAAKYLLPPRGDLVLKVDWLADAKRDWPPERMHKLLGNNGFKVAHTFDIASPAYADLEEFYGQAPAIRRYTEQEPPCGYFVIAHTLPNAG